MTVASTHQVYLVRRESDGAVKICVSRCPVDRLTGLRAEYRAAHEADTEMSILGFIPGSYALAAYFHKYFSEKRIDGEWFFLTEEETCFVLTLPLPLPRRHVPKSAPNSDIEQREAQRLRMITALEDHSWNRTRAAESLGIPRRTFYRRLYEYGILAA